MSFELIKGRFSFMNHLVSGIFPAIILASFFFIAKAVIGPIEFVVSFFNSEKKRSFLERHSIFILLIVSGALIFLNTKAAEFILQPSANIQIIVCLTNICLLAMIFKYGKTALDTPESTNDIVRGLGDLVLFKWFARRLRNPADVIWLKTICVLTILVVPAFLCVLLRSTFSFYTVIMYGIVWWTGSSALSMFEHTNSHHHIFKPQKYLSKRDQVIFEVLNFYTEFILIFMFSRIPKWYEVQHVFVHHQEDNGEKDTQSTLKYDRSSFIDFARCANRFALSGLFSFDIIIYLKKKNSARPLRYLLLGMSVFYVCLAILSFWNWQFAVTILVFRYCSQIMAALGFFHEHGMVDVTAPQNIYRNSIHFITNNNSHTSLGDDAHIEHHLHMGRHWTRYTEDVNHNLKAYSNEGALGYLDGTEGVRQYFKLIWRRDYSKLAQNFIVFGNEEISKEDIAFLLRERTKPLNNIQRPAAFDRLDNVLGRVMGFLLI